MCGHNVLHGRNDPREQHIMARSSRFERFGVSLSDGTACPFSADACWEIAE